jgi:hypothetical protein
MAAIKRTTERLRTIYQRQRSNAFGPDYIPAQLATAREAPSVSRATILCARKLGDREVHLLSRAELDAAFVALYHPSLFDLHEQRMLSPAPCAHPLAGHPRALGRLLPQLPGTVAVLEHLKPTATHPAIRVQTGDDATSTVLAPWPYIGDLLLFLEDVQGPYCVNWTVKSDASGFFSRGGLGAKPSRRGATDPAVLLRHDIERLHYAAGGIRTVQIVGSTFDPELIANLRVLFMHHGRVVDVSAEKIDQIIEALQGWIGSTANMATVLTRVSQRYGIDVFTARVILYQAIWNRRLRIDLFHPVVADHPLVPEHIDVCTQYADLFARHTAGVAP